MLNKVMLIGNLGKDPEVKFLASGQAVCNLRIATSRTWYDKQRAERREETFWADVEVWGTQAEACGEHLSKGRTVYVEGRLKEDTWEDKQTGQKRSKVRVVSEYVRFLGGGRGDHTGAPAPAGNGEEQPPAHEAARPAPQEDIPF